MKYQLKEFTKEHIRNQQLAMSMCGVNVTDKGVELILHGQAAYECMGGKFDLATSSKIIACMDEKYKVHEKAENEQKETPQPE